MLERPGAKIINLAEARRKRENPCPCEICNMEKQGYKMPRLEEKMGELKNYLRFHKPNQNSALMSRAYDKMVILPLATLARSLLNWELDGKNITPEYTLALLMLIKQKISDARVRHNAKIPPPDMI